MAARLVQGVPADRAGTGVPCQQRSDTFIYARLLLTPGPPNLGSTREIAGGSEGGESL